MDEPKPCIGRTERAYAAIDLMLDPERLAERCSTNPTLAAVVAVDFLDPFGASLETCCNSSYTPKGKKLARPTSY
ncbi:hypothetical protein CL622_03940 [archaeon]|nr:hypothetical protein [archaeon]